MPVLATHGGSSEHYYSHTTVTHTALCCSLSSTPGPHLGRMCFSCSAQRRSESDARPRFAFSWRKTEAIFCWLDRWLEA